MLLKQFRVIITLVALAIAQVVPAADVTRTNQRCWQETTATFQIMELELKDLKVDGTLLGLLIQEAGQPLNTLSEADQKTLLTFIITYIAPVQLKGKQAAEERTITQHGLYRTLHPGLQNTFRGYTVPTTIAVRFASDNLIAIEFKDQQNFVPAPALYTDSIDVHWKAKDK